MEDGDLDRHPPGGGRASRRARSTLERLIDERLPLVELSELLVEVDGWTGFSG